MIEKNTDTPPTIRPTFLADCSTWDKGLIHQIEAWEWLQERTDPKVLSEFAAKFTPAGEVVGVANESSPLPKKIVVDWNNPECQISKYFTVREVTNGDRRRIPVAGSEVAKNVLALAIELDKIRKAWGNPIRVTSWYRPVAVNREIGGASRSQHITGCAVDICLVDGDINAFENWIDDRWSGALGYGAAKKGFVHLDRRNGGGYTNHPDKSIRWNY